VGEVLSVNWQTADCCNRNNHTTTTSRANLDCDFFSNLWDIAFGNNPCSTHCVLLDPIWVGVSFMRGWGEGREAGFRAAAFLRTIRTQPHRFARHHRKNTTQSYAMGAATLHFDIGVGLTTTFAANAAVSGGSTSQAASELIKVRDGGCMLHRGGVGLGGHSICSRPSLLHPPTHPCIYPSMHPSIHADITGHPHRHQRGPRPAGQTAGGPVRILPAACAEVCAHGMLPFDSF